MRIGAWTFEPPVFLAPMAGVSNRAFRVLARAEGARLCTTEMVSAKALVLGGARSFAMAELEPGEHPVAVQIAGSDPEIMAEAARLVESLGADIVDINMGCPVPKVVRNGDGSALLTDPDQAARVARAVVEAVRIPVTVKMRAGWDRDHITAPEVAARLEAAGVQAVAVHARTREDRYAGPVNWEYIRRVRERVSIPVIGNGDLDSPVRALRMLEATGADGVMIGRAALGDPWIFRRMVHFWLHGQDPEPPDAGQRAGVARAHLDRLVALKGEGPAVREMRKHLAWYLRGVPGAAELRARIFAVTTRDQALELIEEWRERARDEAPVWN